MAKKCEVCHRTYPDSEPSCPHCAEAIDFIMEEDAGAQAAEPPTEKPPKKKTAARPEPKPEDFRDIEVVDEIGSPGKSAGPESPKKTVVGGRGGQPTQLARKAPAPTMLAPPGSAEEEPSPPTESAAAQGPTPTGPAPSPPELPEELKKTKLSAKSGQPTQLASKTANPTQLASKTPPPTMLAPQEPDEEEAAAAAKQAKARRGPAGADIDVEPVGPVPPGTAPLNLGAPKAPDDADVLDLLAEGAAEGTSAVNLGSHAADKGERPSGLDLIAESVESGVALNHPAGADPVALAEGEHLKAEAAAAADEDEAADVLGSEDDSVNLGAGPLGLADEEDIPVVAKGHGEEEVGIVDEEEIPVSQGGTAVAVRPAVKPKYGRRWAGGILIGILLAAGIVGGLWAAKLVKLPDLDKALGRENNEDKAAKQLAEANQRNKTLNNELEDANKAKKELEDLKAGNKDLAKTVQILKDTAKNLDKENDLPGIPAAVKDLVADQKKLKGQVADLNDMVTTLKKDNDDLAKKAKDTDKDLTDTKAKLAKAQTSLDMVKASLKTALGKEWPEEKEPSEGIDLLGKNLKDLGALVSRVKDKLRVGGYLPADGGTDEVLLAGLDKVIKQAVSPLVYAVSGVTDSLSGASGSLAGAFGQLYDLGKWSAGREIQLAYYRTREPMIQTPQTMLEHYVHELQDRDGPDAAELAKLAERDARWVITQDSQARPVVRARAQFVLGLALRNQLNYEGAQDAFHWAAKEANAADVAELAREAQAASKELTDADALARRYEEFKAADKLEERILPELKAALKIAKGTKGSLLALESKIYLDRALRSAKKLTPQTPGVAQALKAANDAINEEGAKEEGQYALGRVYEELGNLSAARQHYEQAVKFTGRKDRESLYRLALGRILLRLKPADEEEKKEEEKEKAPEKPAKTEARGKARQDKAEALSPVAFLLVGLCVPLAEDEDDLTDEQLKKKLEDLKAVRKLAEEAIALGDPRGYLLLGQVLAREGRWTDGLFEYLKGLRMLSGPRNPVLPKDLADLDELLRNHPTLSLPDSLKPPQPLLAEKHYNLGLEYYWNENYPEAEKEFAEAVKFFPRDARFFYYLGLAHIHQRTLRHRGFAIAHFEKARKLEAEGLPDPEDVSLALERVQGPTRRFLDKYRKP